MDRWLNAIKTHMPHQFSDQVAIVLTEDMKKEAQLKKLEKVGWMNKKGDSHRGWKKRWFVLKGLFLFYYESNKTSKATPKGRIPLSDARLESRSGTKRYSRSIFKFEHNSTLRFPNFRKLGFQLHSKVQANNLKNTRGNSRGEKRIYYLEAETENEKSLWIKALAVSKKFFLCLCLSWYFCIYWYPHSTDPYVPLYEIDPRRCRNRRYPRGQG